MSEDEYALTEEGRRHIEWMRDRVRKMLGLRVLDRHMLALNYDALNEFYGFHGGPCPATSLSVTPTSPRTT